LARARTDRSKTSLDLAAVLDRDFNALLYRERDRPIIFHEADAAAAAIAGQVFPGC
jgi:hypothetical protein